MVVLTNHNQLKMYSDNNYSMAMACEDVTSEPISDVLCLENETRTQVNLRINGIGLEDSIFLNLGYSDKYNEKLAFEGNF